MQPQKPNVFTYPRNEPGTMGHLDLVEPLRALPSQLAETLKGLSDDEVRFRPAEGAWSLKELVGHLRDYAEVQHKRLYMMSTQTDPILEPYDQDAFAAEHGYLEREVGSMLGELAAIRTDTVQLLTSLVNWNWARAGQHAELGRMSIRQLVERMVAHEGTHLAEMRELRTSATG